MIWTVIQKKKWALIGLDSSLTLLLLCSLTISLSLSLSFILSSKSVFVVYIICIYVYKWSIEKEAVILNMHNKNSKKNNKQRNWANNQTTTYWDYYFCFACYYSSATYEFLFYTLIYLMIGSTIFWNKRKRKVNSCS